MAAGRCLLSHRNNRFVLGYGAIYFRYKQVKQHFSQGHMAMNDIKFKRPSIAVLTSAFVIVVCASLIVLDGWRTWNSLTVRMQNMETATAKLTFAMANHADITLQAADVVVLGMVDRVENDGNTPTALARLQTILQALMHQLPQLNGLFVYDEHGRWLADSQSKVLEGVNNADRPYFIYHRDNPDHELHISAPVISRSTGKWVIPVSRRIEHADGSFAGIALATIDIDYFRDFYDSLDLGHDGNLALIMNDGVMLLQRPYHTEDVGHDISSSLLYQSYMSYQPGKPRLFKFVQDGTTRWTSYHGVEHYPLFIAGSFAKQDLLDDWRSSTLLQLSASILLVLMLAFFGARLIKQARLREAAESELLRARDALQVLNRKLEKQVMQDGLTGLANRRHFDQMLAREYGRAARMGRSLALIMIDIDFFKQYNDIYGHPAGDECLRAVSRAIRDETPTRPGDLAARYGGEEMVILLPETDMAGAMTVAQRIHASIHELDLPHRGSTIGIVTVSTGVDALIPQRDLNTPESLLLNADKALYVAKSCGRDRVCSSRDSQCQNAHGAHEAQMTPPQRA